MDIASTIQVSMENIVLYFTHIQNITLKNNECQFQSPVFTKAGTFIDHVMYGYHRY